MHRIEKLKENK